MVLDGEECSGSSITSRFSSKEPQHDHALFWAFVTIKDKITNGGDNKFWSCNLIRIKEMQEEVNVEPNWLKTCLMQKFPKQSLWF